MKAISRKAFLKGAVASASAAAAASVLTACGAASSSAAASSEAPAPAPAAPVEAAPSIAWDAEAEVLILGAGGAGMCAGITAAKAGAKTMILEKSDNFGGTSIRSGGIIQASGTHVQKELTEYQDDTAEKHAAYYIQEGEGTLDEALVKDMTAGSAHVIEWLESLGLEFTNMSGSAHTTMADEANYADRIHGTSVGAAGIFNAVHDEAVAQGVEFVYNTEATKLICEDGRVVGVEAKQDGKTICVKGSKGVIICTSSIDHNLEMSKMLNPNQYYDLQYAHVVAYSYNTGDGIRMGAEVGAQLTNFGGVIDLTGVTSAGINRQTPMIPGFFVNKMGRRFTCEDCTYALTSRELWREITRTNHACYTICGAESMAADRLEGMVASGAAFKANTIAELAAQIDVNAANLQRTLDQWNEDAANGVDTQFERMTGLAALKAPYYAFQEGFLNLGSIGGMKINLNCEVQNVNGKSIPGLYAAGMASAGWVGPFYPGSGTALLGSIHFGLKAGEIVAKL